MSQGSLANRYAKALFEVADEKKLLDEVEKDLRLIVDTVEKSQELQSFLEHPQVDDKAKVEVLEKLFRAQVSDIVFNFVRMILERGRFSLLKLMFNGYMTLANEARGIADATVVSAAPLGVTRLSQIAAEFGGKLGKSLRVNNVVDPSMIGGITIRVGDRIYDGSIKGKLSRFKKTLAQS